MACASHLVWYWMLKKYLAWKLGTLSFMTPLFAVAMGALIGQEPVSHGFMIGTLLALTGLVIANFPMRRGTSLTKPNQSVAKDPAESD